MSTSGRQREYWNRVAEEKQFTHPLDAVRFGELVPESAAILDVGCGYGRTWAHLDSAGYSHIIGIDIAEGMIERGRLLHPRADLRLWEGGELPFPEGTFDAVILFAVLTCVPADDAQKHLIGEVGRVLRPDGILYVSDYPIQKDARNRARYARFESQYGKFGVFELAEGVVLRHHSAEWIDALLSPFPRVGFRVIDVPTMNGNMSEVFQYLGKKLPRSREHVRSHGGDE